MIKYTLFVIALLMLAGCSEPVSNHGGGSEAGNANIVGTVIFSNGETASGCLVSAVPVGYIPDLHTAAIISRAVTNSQGHFSLETPESDSFNLFIVDTTTKEQVLLRNLCRGEEFLNLGEMSLKRPGILKLIHPDISHESCRFYIRGTEYTHIYSSHDTTNDTLFIEVPPLVELPLLQLAIGERPFSIANALVTPDKAVSITLDTTELAIWNFSVIAGISKETMAAANNYDSLKALIEVQIATVNARFNNDRGLKGHVNFSLDSVSVLSGSVAEEIAKELIGFDYRIVYHGHGSDTFDSWSMDTRTIVNHQDESSGFGKNLFGAETTLWLASRFGLARGCSETASMEVASQNNSISQSPYVPDLTIMFKPEVYSTWCSFNLAVLNLYADSVVQVPYICSAPLQETVSVSVADFVDNSPVTDATVDLFWVDPVTAIVTDTAAFSGKTDEKGVMTFVHNPYRPKSLELPAAYYTNALIRVYYEGKTSFSWLTILQLGEAYIKDPVADFTLTVTL